MLPGLNMESPYRKLKITLFAENLSYMEKICCPLYFILLTVNCQGGSGNGVLRVETFLCFKARCRKEVQE